MSYHIVYSLFCSAPYRMFLDASLDELAVAANRGLSTEEDQTGDLCSMGYHKVVKLPTCSKPYGHTQDVGVGRVLG